MLLKFEPKKLVIVCFSLLCFQAVLFAEIQVLVVSPTGDTSGEVDTISVTFNKPMVPLEQLPEGNGAGPLLIEPPIAGKYRWQGTRTLTFTIKGKLPFATTYKVTIPKGIKSEISNEKLEQQYSWSFNTLRPDLLQSYPIHNLKWVELDTKIFLLFNQPMAPRQVKSFIRLKEYYQKQIIETSYTARYMVEKDTLTLQNLESVPYEIFRATHSHVLVITPEKELNKDSYYSIEIKSGLLGTEGTLGLYNDRIVGFKTYNTFRFIGPVTGTEIEPTSEVIFSFTNPVKYYDFIKSTTIYPDIEFPDYSNDEYSYFNKDYNNNTCSGYFSFNLKPGKTYTIKVKGSLQDIYGQTLGNDIVTSFTTTDYNPYIYMNIGMGIIESYLTPPRYPIKLLNINQVKLQKAIINYNDIISFVSQNYINSGSPVTPPGGYKIDRIWEPKINKNEVTLLPLELKEVLDTLKYGIIYIQLYSDDLLDRYDKYRQVLLQVTSMGITGKFSPDGNLIYVSYLKTANPVIDCIVELRDNNNNIIWTGKTGEDGFVKTPGWEELKIVPEKRWEKPKLWVIARKSDDVAFSNCNWGTGIDPYQFGLSYEWSPEYPKYAGHLFTDRGIYRPSETVYVKGIIRENRFGKWEIPRITNYNLFIKDSRSQEVAKTTVTLSDFGAFDFTYNIDKNSPTGYYRLFLWDSRISTTTVSDDDEYDYDYRHDRMIRFSDEFRVEEYKPATFEVTVNTDKKEYIIGDAANIKINSRYLFGAAMPGAELEYTARLDQSYFEPEGFPGYVFGRNYWDDREYYSSPGIIKSEKTVLDKEGNFSFDCELITQNPGTYNLIAEGLVTAPDRQRLAGRKSVLVHNGEYYIGLKPMTAFIEKGKNIQVNIITVTPDSQKVSGKELSGLLKQIEWYSVRKAGVNGRLEWQTEKKETVLSSFTFVSTQEPYQWIHKPEKSGYYVLSIEGKDSRDNKIKSTQYFYVTGKDYCAWARSDDDKIDLICDKIKYKPGDTAKILVKSPYEEANAVITIEREGIISQWRKRIVGSADTVEIPITKDYLPNIFVCVMLYQGRISENKFSESGDDIGKPSFKIGYTNLPVDPGDKNLNVKVDSDKNEYRPGSKVNLKIKVTDSQNKGVASEVTVAVVDLGILNLINYQTPNSFPYFYGPRPLSVETSETRLHIIGQRNYGEKGENRGGGGGIFSAIDVRSKFVPTVYWNPKVITNETGFAEVTFTLADNLTTFRIMATAQTKDACFGAGEKRFMVNKPLLLKPSLPRFARLGDEFSAGVLCHNNTANSGIVTINVQTKGIKLLSEDTTQVYLNKGDAKEIKFDFVADKTTQAEFVFKAVMNTETDGLKWSIPVTFPKPTEAVATYSSTIDKSVEGIKIPANIFDEASSINVSLASTAMVGLKGGMEYLFQYPYGCCEQKTSKILPLILGANFIDMFDLAPLKAHSAKELITNYLNELPQYQGSSGGFSFWKDRSIESPYLTAYVLWAIAEAKKNGYTVNETMRTKAVEYLKSYLRGDSQGWNWPYNVNEELTTKSFCVYSLSINGSHEQSYINHLYQKLFQMPLFGKIYLLKAINSERMDTTMIDTIIRDLYNNAKISPTEVHFEELDNSNMSWIWSSNMRTTAAILQGLLEVKGEYPNSENIIKWMVKERKNGSWRTTQENMYVLYAFNEYVKIYEKDTPDFVAKVLIEEKEIIKEMFSGRTLNPVNIKLAVDSYKRDILLPVTFEKTGAGRLYYDFRMVYSPKGELKPRDEGISVIKTIVPFNSYKIENDTYSLSGRYKVTLKVKTNQQRHFVVLDDPIPAGFEVVNLSFATESQEENKDFENSTNDSYRYWGTFDHWENYDDKVIVFANYLQRGEHTYSYLVQATTSGEFILPPAKAEEMYTPEVFGRTDQKKIVIR